MGGCNVPHTTISVVDGRMGDLIVLLYAARGASTRGFQDATAHVRNGDSVENDVGGEQAVRCVPSAPDARWKRPVPNWRFYNNYRRDRLPPHARHRLTRIDSSTRIPELSLASLWNQRSPLYSQSSNFSWYNVPPLLLKPALLPWPP